MEKLDDFFGKLLLIKGSVDLPSNAVTRTLNSADFRFDGGGGLRDLA
jgi:hypothetical protein